MTHTPPNTFAPTPPAARRGAAAFTLTELLIVIGLIVLVIALAVPAFKAMTGGRSIDAAQNQLAAVLGAARAEAIGLQKVRGVFFYTDPATLRVNAAIVQEVGFTPTKPPPISPDYYLDLVPDRDPVALPVGVGLQGIDNADFGGAGVRRDDGYIGYNVLPPDVNPKPDNPDIRFGGVILFDGYGRVVNKFYGFVMGQVSPNGRGKQLVPTRIAELLGYKSTTTPPEYFVARQDVGSAKNPMQKHPPQSLFGFALYDAEPFRSLGFTDGDPQFDPSVGAYGGNELKEEQWLDQNATPILINRYNGTLVRGE